MPLIKKSKVVHVSNRRGEERRPPLFVTQVIVLRSTDRVELSVECLNISATGLAFRTTARFAIGEKIAVRMQFCNRDGQLMLCEVRHCLPGNSDHRIGARILETVTAARGQAEIPVRWRSEP